MRPRLALAVSQRQTVPHTFAVKAVEQLNSENYTLGWRGFAILRASS